jgi:multidrug efflux pump
MSFSDLFIRRPVLSTVLACMILLLGFQGIFNLSIRQYPKVDETAITITTAYPGASADLIQGFISAPIARAVASTENIDYVTSSSRPSSSTVTVQMKLGSNPDVALTEVLSKVQGVRGTLPDASKDRSISSASSGRACRRWKASPTCRSSAPRNTRCASGSIRSSLPRAV